MFISYPINVEVFSKIIISLIHFDLLDPEWTTRYVFDFKLDDSNGLEDMIIPKTAFSHFGFETKNPILNLGGIFALIGLYFVQIALLVMIIFAKLVLSTCIPKKILSTINEGGQEDKEDEIQV